LTAVAKHQPAERTIYAGARHFGDTGTLTHTSIPGNMPDDIAP
jgi:hypothetical protein